MRNDTQESLQDSPGVVKLVRNQPGNHAPRVVPDDTLAKYTAAVLTMSLLLQGAREPRVDQLSDFLHGNMLSCVFRFGSGQGHSIHTRRLHAFHILSKHGKEHSKMVAAAWDGVVGQFRIDPDDNFLPEGRDHCLFHAVRVGSGTFPSQRDPVLRGSGAGRALLLRL